MGFARILGLIIPSLLIPALPLPAPAIRKQYGFDLTPMALLVITFCRPCTATPMARQNPWRIWTELVGIDPCTSFWGAYTILCK